MGPRARHPIVGRERILRFYEGLARKGRMAAAEAADRVTLNGLPGFILHSPHGDETLALEISRGQVVALFAVRNPDKPAHLRGLEG